MAGYWCGIGCVLRQSFLLRLIVATDSASEAKFVLSVVYRRAANASIIIFIKYLSRPRCCCFTKPHAAEARISAGRYAVFRASISPDPEGGASWSEYQQHFKTFEHPNAQCCPYSIANIMDYAYDRVQESALPDDASEDAKKAEQQQGSLNNDFQEAYKAISSSPWGARLGGFFGSVAKQVSVGDSV